MACQKCGSKHAAAQAAVSIRRKRKIEREYEMKKLLAFLLSVVMVLSLTGCGKEMTLEFSFGERTGTYSGDLSEQGLPNGQGKFTTTNSEGDKWTYEGAFVNGHFEGEGKTTWKNGRVEIGTYKNDVIVPMKGDEILSLYTNPENFKNHCVELTGVVFTTPEYTDTGVCVQMMADIKNYDKNTIVYIYDKDFRVEKDDYLRVVGIVGDPFEGKNAFGATITAPVVDAKEYEICSYADAASPTLKTVEVDQTETQFGYSVTVNKVEYAENETRIYMTVNNDGSDTFNVYSFDMKISQNGKQYEQQDNWDADYPELQSELLPGNSSEGVVTFPALAEGEFTLAVEGHSDNWEEEISPYTFHIAGS